MGRWRENGGAGWVGGGGGGSVVATDASKEAVSLSR